MLKSITLPGSVEVGQRLRNAFGNRLFIQLDGTGWGNNLTRCLAVAPTHQIEIAPEQSTDVWQLWRSGLISQESQIEDNGALEGPSPGWFGYLGYEAGRPLLTPYFYKLPVAAIGFFPCVVLERAHEIEVRYLESHQALAQQISDVICNNAPIEPAFFDVTSTFCADIPLVKYQQEFSRIVDYIHAGDTYQVNYAQRFSANFTGDPYPGYCAVQETIASPYAGFVGHRDGCVLSFSPEQFLSLNERNIHTTPIKGTRPRLADADQNALAVAELQSSIKDQAENLMIVDLLRNDLSRVSEIGSVAVPSLFKVESFAHVHHLVSTVTARLRSNMDAIDLIQACFPGGSITGAPKRRACEIIAEVESQARAAYCGSLFFVDVTGKMQSNILIRTLVANEGKLYCWGGGGIVADSMVQSEYDETLHKVGKLMKLFEQLKRR